jgi:3-phosphoshikimate 1-carboxyvinyltransferase
MVPPGGTEAEPLDLFVGNAGTAARFLVPFLCLGSGVYRLHGAPRMHERPQAALFEAVRELGFRVESDNGDDKLPARIFSGTAGLPPETQTEFNLRKAAPAPPKKCRVSIAESSQFASALLLASKAGRWQVEITGENAEESPYVAMTVKLIEVFPNSGGSFQIEPDASSGSYFWAANTLLNWFDNGEKTEILIRNWPESGWQIDEKFRDYSKRIISGGGMDASRERDLGDGIMTAIVMSSHGKGQSKKFTDLGRLRVQECERVVALRTELTKCGVKVIEEGDTLTVYPSKPEELHGAEIETYNDHRLAMCFAILGLKVPGIRIKNPACVKKTFPNFFQKLAEAPPQGLGVEIWEVQGGARIRKLCGEDLFAD